MNRRALTSLVSEQERSLAKQAAAAIRAALSDPSKAGSKVTAHVLLARPRRGLWLTTWSGLPGLARSGSTFTHALLAGWEYSSKEMKTEMLEDLERLAETGERPTGATR